MSTSTSTTINPLPSLSSSASTVAADGSSSTVDHIVASVKTLLSTTSTPTSTSAATAATNTLAAEQTTTAPKLNVAELSVSLQHFGIMDYLVFVLMLVVCAVIGFYFGFVEKRKKKREAFERRGSEALEYLVGGRKMKVFPVSLSLVASFVSGISLLGTSTEIYVYGTQYAFILITLAISGVISWYVFLPVFCNLQLTSTYEYFEMRFDKSIRLLGSILFTIGTIIWLPIVIYVPALAFNQVTGVNIHIVTPLVCAVCIFYTCVGGLKAVVWTDVIQTVIMVGAIILVIVKGTIDVGGLGVVLERNWESGRIEVPALTWDPTVRVSMFSIFAGSTIFFIQCTASNQVIVQRYLALPTINKAKQACIIFTVGIIFLTAICFYNGLLIFATYHDCDPLTTKLAKAGDQLVPLLVMDILNVYPGMPGLFVAGVFSAALSSLSTGMNSLAAVILEDFIKPLTKTELTEHQTAVIMRVSVVLTGVLSVALVFVVERLGTVLQLSMALGSISSGPLVGLFLMGLLLPWINGKYFELRFGRGVRYFGSVLFIVGMVLYLPVAIYVPALTFNQVSGIDVHTITPIVCGVCTFYTCVGGLKAVIWTDVIQSFVMYGSILTVCIKGTLDVGGLDVLVERNAAGGRFNAPDWTWDPTVRLSMLSVVVGGTLHKIQSSDVNQVSIQRFLSLPSFRQAKQTMILFTVFLMFLLSCCCYMGLLTYATYYDCDPLSTKLVRAHDQLPVILVMRILGEIPGLPGLFVAGVFSAALSSLSTGLNSLACVISQDVVKSVYKKPLTEYQTAILLRAIVIFFGVGCIFLVFIVEKLGMVLQLASMTGAVTMGPLLGVYAIGVCLPWINQKYLERRFDRRVRLFGSVLFVLLSLLWMPISIYVPALTFNQVTGINIHVITPIVCLVCTVYTSIGGIKGVVWTDVLQGVIILLALIVVIIKGTLTLGGIDVVYQRSLDSGRIEAPEWTFDPTVRMGFFAVFVGGALFKLQVTCINQSTVQRFLALPNLQAVRKCLIISLLGLMFLLGLCSYLGLLAYAAYHDCDPITTKLARAKDQVVPLYVMEIAGMYPGVTGLFVSGVFSAALSSLSTCLNSLSGVILKDFIEPYRTTPLSEHHTAIILRSVVVVFGLLSMAMVRVVEKLGLVMQLSATVGSITAGPLLGVFTVGMLMPFINTNSVLTGCSVAVSILGYIAVRAQIAMAVGELHFPTKPVSVEGCFYEFLPPFEANSTLADAPEFVAEKGIHHISFLWYTAVGAITTIVVSLLSTLYFGKQNIHDVDPELVVPLLRRYVKPPKYVGVPNGDAEKKDYLENDFVYIECKKSDME